MRIGATFLAVATAIVLFFSSAPLVRSDVEPDAEPPAPRELAPIRTIDAIVTGYSSDVAQTDDTPNITASGSRVHDGSIACPTYLSFGTQVRIYGKTYVCDDRMAAKYRSKPYFDVWFPSTEAAIHFGRVRAEVEVLR